MSEDNFGPHDWKAYLAVGVAVFVIPLGIGGCELLQEWRPASSFQKEHK